MMLITLENLKMCERSGNLEEKKMDPLLEAEGVMGTGDREKAQLLYFYFYFALTLTGKIIFIQRG